MQNNRMQSASSVDVSMTTSVTVSSHSLGEDSAALGFADQRRGSRTSRVRSNLPIDERRGSRSESDASSRASQNQDSTSHTKKIDFRNLHTKIPISKWTWEHRQKAVSPIPATLEDDLTSNTISSNNTSSLVGGFFSSLLPSSGCSNKKRFRAKEELCVMLPGDEKVWYLREGFIGREIDKDIFLTTRDRSMDPFHAQVTLQGDDYLIRDNGTTNGTYLCLSTLKRHQPQRHGFRLKPKDVILVGKRGRIVINELRTTVRTQRCQSNRAAKLKLERRLTDISHLEHVDLDKKKSKKVSFGQAEIENDPYGVVGSPYLRTKSSSMGSKINKSIQSPAVLENKMPSSSITSGSSVVLGELPSSVNSVPNENGAASSGTFQENIPVHLGVTIYSYPNKTKLTPEKTMEEEMNGPQEALGSGITLDFAGQQVYTIGSGPKCDIRVQGKGIRGVHARIIFDGHSFVLQDVSFEADVKLKTRVLLSRSARIEKGDVLLLGKNYVLCVVNKSRAFSTSDKVNSRNNNNSISKSSSFNGIERTLSNLNNDYYDSYDVLDVALRCQLLRTSKRKKRQRIKFAPLIFALPKNQDVRVGKHSDCEVYVHTATMCTEQFKIRYNETGCMIIPSSGGINQGLYLLLGRSLFTHEQIYDDSIQFTSKALILGEGTIFRCGSSEIEVAYIKHQNTHTKFNEDLRQKAQEVEENVQLLASMPWLDQIAMDTATIENLAQHAIRVRLETGATVYNTGDPASFLFLVVSGEVSLFYSMDSTSSSNNSSINASTSSERNESIGTASTNPNDRSTPDLMEIDAAAKATAAAVAEATVATGADKTSSSSCGSTLERVPAGSFFGEVCLFGNDMEYRETARAFSPTVLLIFNREDLGGYLDRYMDILMAHFTYERYKPLLFTLRKEVSLFQDIAYQDLRHIANQFEKVTFTKEKAIFQDGKLTKGSTENGGIVIFLSGNVDLKHGYTSNTERHSNLMSNHKGSITSSATTTIGTPSSESSNGRSDESAFQPFDVLMDCKFISPPSSSSIYPSLDGNSTQSNGRNGSSSEDGEGKDQNEIPEGSTDDSSLILQSVPVTNNLYARSFVEVLILPQKEVEKILLNVQDANSSQDQDKMGNRPQLVRRRSIIKRRNSSLALRSDRSRRSQVISALELEEAEAEEPENRLENATLEEGIASVFTNSTRYTPTSSASPSTSQQRWRRKKKNRLLLEKTIAAIQMSPDLTNAMILYVLSGANRGDIHVVRNVATIGKSFGTSGSIATENDKNDIELNDIYVSKRHAFIEHREGKYWLYDNQSEWGTYVRMEELEPVEVVTGDIYLAGEMEFTCLATFPNRIPSQSCCLIQ